MKLYSPRCIENKKTNEAVFPLVYGLTDWLIGPLRQLQQYFSYIMTSLVYGKYQTNEAEFHGCMENNKQMKLYSPGCMVNNKQMKLYSPRCMEN